MKTFIILSALCAISVSAATVGQPVPQILRQSQDIYPDGTYSFEFETVDGTKHSENGVGGVRASGQYEYTAPDGTPVELSYVADENGYQPTGSHIHPVPDYILRSIEYNEKHAPKQVTVPY